MICPKSRVPRSNSGSPSAFFHILSKSVLSSVTAVSNYIKFKIGGQAPQCSSLGLHLCCRIPHGYWFDPQMLHFLPNSLLMYLGKQQEMTSSPWALLPLQEAPGSLLWTSPSLAVATMCAEHQWMEDLSLSCLSTYLSTKTKCIFINF